MGHKPRRRLRAGVTKVPPPHKLEQNGAPFLSFESWQHVHLNAKSLSAILGLMTLNFDPSAMQVSGNPSNIFTGGCVQQWSAPAGSLHCSILIGRYAPTRTKMVMANYSTTDFQHSARQWRQKQQITTYICKLYITFQRLFNFKKLDNRTKIDLAWFQKRER